MKTMRMTMTKDEEKMLFDMVFRLIWGIEIFMTIMRIQEHYLERSDCAEKDDSDSCAPDEVDAGKECLWHENQRHR